MMPFMWGVCVAEAMFSVLYRMAWAPLGGNIDNCKS